jgi:hypothetical protein
MSPITHFFAGWLLASVSPTGRPTTLTRREKALVVAAAVAPDIDGFGIIPELLTRNTSHPLLWFSAYHHSLHTLGFALICTLAAYLIVGPFAASGIAGNLTAGPSTKDHFLISHSARLSRADLVLFLFLISLLAGAFKGQSPRSDACTLIHGSPRFWFSSASIFTCCAT